jgi:uncharacterized membrane protein
MAQRVVDRLNRLNRTVAFVATMVLVVAALLLPGVIGGVLLLAVVAGLAILLQATWPRHDSRRRAARLAVLVLAVIIAVLKLTS